MQLNDIRRVQDDKREKQLADKFHLDWQENRIGPDALDERLNKYELKTTTRDAVSTARDLGPNHITRWRERFWIIANGRNYRDEYIFDRIFFLSRCHMEEWYQRLMNGFNSDIALSARVRFLIDELAFDPTEVFRVERLLHRGMLLNDPGIPWKYVLDNGIEITEDYPKMLRQLVVQYPLAHEVTFSTGYITIGDRSL